MITAAEINARYLRYEFTDSTFGNGSVELRDIDVYSAGVNISSTASITHTANISGSVSNLTDSNIFTIFRINDPVSDAAPGWIEIDFGSPKAIQRIVTNQNAANGHTYQLFMSNDGSSWTSFSRLAANAFML